MSNIHTTAKPTVQLRWRETSAGRVLQQAWETVHYEGARPVRFEVEWRDIPVVHE